MGGFVGVSVVWNLGEGSGASMWDFEVVLPWMDGDGDYLPTSGSWVRERGKGGYAERV